MFLHTSWQSLQIWASKTAQTNSMLQYSETVFSSYDIASPTPWPLSAVQSRMLDLGSQKNRGLGLREKFFAKVLWKFNLAPNTTLLKSSVFLFQALSALWCSLPFLDLHDAPELVNGPCDKWHVWTWSSKMKALAFDILRASNIFKTFKLFCKLAKPNLVLCCWCTSTFPLGFSTPENWLWK